MKEMAEALDLRNIVNHLVNGSLGDNLCLVCLHPLTEDNCENIFTTICTEDEEYCIANVLREICRLKISDSDHYSVCLDCFNSATFAYKFYIQAKRSNEILYFYMDQLSKNIENIENNTEDVQLFCIQLPAYVPETPGLDVEIEGIGTRNMGDSDNDDDVVTDQSNDEGMIVIIEEEQTVLFDENDELQRFSENEVSDDENVLMIVDEKKRKKRDKMAYISCTHCPVKYRFLSKLRDHMKNVHNVDIFYCRICKYITHSKEDLEQHLTTHVGQYQCVLCNARYRKMESLEAHVEWHERTNQELADLTHTGNICETCGIVLENESALEEHCAEKHVKKYTCFYCGRLYKARISFESHIAKHEKNKAATKPEKQNSEHEENAPENAQRSVCKICDKTFVDERSLLWHRRLHDNIRPYKCDVCGRGFVSLNRRNQHALCAHTPPTHRCPLCPALFHLRSMVNTHVKKVHLNKQHRRRNRAVKHRHVLWKTETVPIQDLSVAIQNEVLEMKTSQEWDKKQSTQSDSPIASSLELINDEDLLSISSDPSHQHYMAFDSVGE